MSSRGAAFGAFAFTCSLVGPAPAAETVTIGSKSFTESVVIGELASGLARSTGVDVEHRRELGGTRVLWEALLAGEIDAYPEYTGTLSQEILEGVPAEAVPAALAERGLSITAPLGFNNTYALGATKESARKLGLSKLSDLASLEHVRLGFSTEFMERKDGWPGLRQRYGFVASDVRGLDHDLAYRALAAGELDAIDLYATDAEIRLYDLVILDDDAAYFPRYEALLVFREDLEARAPEVVRALRRLEGAIDADAMRTMNAEVKVEHKSEQVVATEFLQRHLQVSATFVEEGPFRRLLKNTLDHLLLVVSAVIVSILLAVPLAVVAVKRPRFGRVVLGLAGVIQTIPSLALLVALIPVSGLGSRTAIVALVLYGLLPILRGTFVGLSTLPKALSESAEALGLEEWARLRRVELPLAAPHIFSGIQTSAVITVGTATLAALIGAGGYGQPILTGVRLARTSLLLEGAVPAATMALVVQLLFERLERKFVSKGLTGSRS